MEAADRNFQVIYKRKFVPAGIFPIDQIRAVFEFAYDMTFGERGEHRAYRSGGMKVRTPLEIFADAFQGKLSEYAIYNMFGKLEGIPLPDLSKFGLGVWEEVDFQFDRYRFSIKSTKSYADLLLLEKKDWDGLGHYLQAAPNSQGHTHIVLVRVNPDIQSIAKGLPDMKEDSRWEVMLSTLLSFQWSADSPGFITIDDLVRIIGAGHVIKQGDILNKYISMDADNYYVQSGDLRPFAELRADVRETLARRA